MDYSQVYVHVMFMLWITEIYVNLDNHNKLGRGNTLYLE